MHGPFNIKLVPMPVFIFSSNTRFRTLYIQFSSTTFFGHFGHHQVDFTKTYMEKNAEVEASVYVAVKSNLR